jgi:hypothetical protein
MVISKVKNESNGDIWFATKNNACM